MEQYPLDEHRIVQVIPAGGWHAEFYREKTGTHVHEPLICWALMEAPTPSREREVTGLRNGNPRFCEESGNFTGYVHSSQIPGPGPDPMDWLIAAGISPERAAEEVRVARSQDLSRSFQSTIEAARSHDRTLDQRS